MFGSKLWIWQCCVCVDVRVSVLVQGMWSMSDGVGGLLIVELVRRCTMGMFCGAVGATVWVQVVSIVSVWNICSCDYCYG